MTARVLTFFNNKGGVGKTSLVYHVAWMMSELSYPVLVVDLDPQANLTAAFLDERALEKLWDVRDTSSVLAPRLAEPRTDSSPVASGLEAAGDKLDRLRVRPAVGDHAPDWLCDSATRHTSEPSDQSL